MKTNQDVENLEKLLSQLKSLHNEISQLAKKSPNDGLNLFKLKLVNKVIQNGNQILGSRYKPFEDFNEFEEQSIPTNSDTTMILALYLEQAERFRSDNVIYNDFEWHYVVNGKPSNVSAKPPTMVGIETR